MNLREIDRLVAEKVIGCEEAPSIWFDEYDKTKKYYCISVTSDKEISIIEYGDRGWVQYLFHPSENIADAWQVVEKLYKDKGLRMFVGLNFPPLYEARLMDEKGDWIGHGVDAETAPLAICLAALKAVDVDIDTIK
jgi:hypothetical protein